MTEGKPSAVVGLDDLDRAVVALAEADALV
jgi:hypothetical protein